VVTTANTYTGVGEQRGKKLEIKINLPPQELNCFMNDFVEHVQVVCRYPNKPQ